MLPLSDQRFSFSARKGSSIESACTVVRSPNVAEVVAGGATLPLGGRAAALCGLSFGFPGLRAPALRTAIPVRPYSERAWSPVLTQPSHTDGLDESGRRTCARHIVSRRFRVRTPRRHRRSEGKGSGRTCVMVFFLRSLHFFFA